MKKKVLAIILAFALIVTIALPASAVKVSAAPASTVDWNVERYGDVLDIGTSMREKEADDSYAADLEAQLAEQAKGINFSEDAAAQAADNDGNFTYDGGTKYFVGYKNGSYYIKTYTLRSVGDKAEVWVANDLSFADDRPTPVITQEQVDKVRDTFDSRIYGTDTDFFGVPDSHYGTKATLIKTLGLPQNYYEPADGKERIMILVDNVRDDQYFDPTYPFYIAGFFSSSLERYFDRNIITIDTLNWTTKLEETFLPTLAHEFQHLIHNDNDSGEETFVNEGMSDFAEYLCGFGQPMRHINFFLDHPENSLVNWDEQLNAATGPETLADYGQAYLLTLYMYEHYGHDFIQSLAKGTDHGITSINRLLDQYGAGIDFTELFKRFTVAVAIDSPQPGDGIYNYDSIDLQVNFASAKTFEKDGVPAWGADYNVIDKAMKVQDIKFDGVSFIPTPWKVVDDPKGSGSKVLWSNEGNEIDNMLVLNADLTSATNATLKFDNFYSIEEQWDFGFVQVSTDGGNTWKSLENGNTRYDIIPDEGYPAIQENLPGFTGTNGNWAKESFDLTPYAGKQIMLNFRYMTDWGTNGTGWFIKNIEIPEIGYNSDGSSLEGFIGTDEIMQVPVEYAVTFINEKSMGKGNNEQHYQVLNIDPFKITETDSAVLKGFFSGGNNYMVIWYAAPEGKKGVADFNYEIVTKSDHNKNKNIDSNPGNGNGKKGK